MKLPADWRSWPLHLKLVGALSWPRAREVVEAAGVHDVCVYDAFLDKLFHPRGDLRPASSLPLSDISSEDVSRLLASGRIEPIRESTMVCPIIPFSVGEQAKRRRRFIAHPEEQNEDVDVKVGMARLSDIEEGVRLHEGARLTDIAAYYQHFELPTTTRCRYSFRCSSGCFQLTTAPTGHSHCSGIAQMLSESLAWLEPPRGLVAVYNDNFRCSGDALSSEHDMLSIKQAGAYVGLTFNELETPFLQTYDFLGVRCDHVKKTLALTDRTVAKLMEVRGIITSDMANVSMKTFRSFMGLLIFASSILRTRLAQFYYVLKCFRRRCSSDTDDSATSVIWPSCRAPLLAWCNLLLTNTPRQVLCRQLCEVVLFTDASLTGWGAVLFMDGQHFSFGSKWISDRVNINELEACALRLAIQHFAYLLQNRHIKLVVDNSSLFFTYGKGRSRNFIMNSVIREVDDLVHDLGSTSEIAWVESQFNWADKPSRTCN